jgi:hypothetical protein
MTAKPPPIPPANRSPDPGKEPSIAAGTAPNKRKTDRHRNLGEQGRQGNIHQNTTNQGYHRTDEAMVKASRKHFGAGAHGKGAGAGAMTDIEVGKVPDSGILSNQDKSQHDKDRSFSVPFSMGGF